MTASLIVQDRLRLRTTTALSTALLGSLAVLCAPSAYADGCNLLVNPANGHQTCVLTTSSAPGAAAEGASGADGEGHDGGSASPALSVNLDVEGSLSLYDYPPAAASPVQADSFGGAGAQGSNATRGGIGKSGGSGGSGGRGGDITVSIGPSVSGVSQDDSIGISGLTVLSLGGEGGATAKGNESGQDGKPNGIGGDGGDVTATLDGTFVSDHFRSAYIGSWGGQGGAGRNYEIGLDTSGADAANGGNAGTVTASLQNSTNSLLTDFSGQAGVVVASLGGAGGVGGNAASIDGAQGGTGGNGGNGNAVTVNVGSNVHIYQENDNDAGLQAISAGGSGGGGGSNGGSGGNAGAGGNANNVSVIFTGADNEIHSNGRYSPGVLAQSLGGNGGDGGSASSFVIGPNGGAGTTGGTAGTVSITGMGLNVQSGQYVPTQDLTVSEGAPGVLAQSVGGGGGSGDPAKGIFAVGGNGGNGVNGNNVLVSLQSTVLTYGFGADGLAAQSIGGGGGNGGDASGTSVGIQYVVGGTGGGGGNGATAQLTSLPGSRITTMYDHATGLVVQSIGGGGGQGGAAYSRDYSAGFGSSMSLGGDGGAGGDGGTVSWADGQIATNEGRVFTAGSDSYGILAQSIGGGGGAGGASTAKAHVYAAEDVSISLTVAIGGTGGAGGAGGTVQTGNSGLIATTGAGSVGILAQSVGGGGGSGGDSSSAATASGGEYSFSASFAFGGNGGGAGQGGNASAINSGVIMTAGESADGVLVQSVGGGGGQGGSGDAQAKTTGGDDLSGSIAMGVGAKGGGGGDGFNATATNQGGTIITLGDGAIGLGAQAVGGGGGRAGGGAGSTSGTYSATVSLGGKGGDGGDTYHYGNGLPTSAVTVNNSVGSTIVTFGADATGIMAQSIGGGGGIGGKAGSNLATSKSNGDGGNGGAAATGAVAQAISSFDANGDLRAYAGLNNAVSFTNSLLGNTTSLQRLGDDDVDGDLDDAAQSKGETEDDNDSKSIGLVVSLGGSGGAGGSAGAVFVNNDGSVATIGNHSDAILAQGIGGGGGKGGAASTASSDDYSGSLSVGGTGSSGGNGGQITVNNTGTLITEGALAAGIVGQSVGGGGGIGGVSASSVNSDSKNSGDSSADDGAFKSIQLSLGGNGGSGGTGGQVKITSSGAISTKAHDSIGIVAQSVGGGGGIIKTLATDLEGAGGSASSKGTDYDIQLKFGGAGGATGNGGLANVTTDTGGTITTKGDDSYGILAQSIGGGGGLVLGGKPQGSSATDFFGTGAKSGDAIDDGGSNSGVSVSVGDAINTSGQGGVGVFAQSIGGGGGIAGDVGHTMQLSSIGRAGNSGGFTGNGGQVTVNVAQGGSITTTSGNSPGIIAQSVGGGGGWITNSDFAYIGSAGGNGTGGAIQVNVNGSVDAQGAASAGIFAQSTGGEDNGGSGSGGTITINIGGASNATASVWGGNGFGAIAAAVYVRGGSADVVNNYGVINTHDTTGGYAIYEDSAPLTVNNFSTGVITGNTVITGNFNNQGIYNPISTVNLNGGTLINDGVINCVHSGSTTVLNGNLTQGANGVLYFVGDSKTGAVGTVKVSGEAIIDGQVEFSASPTHKVGPVTVLTATGGVTVEKDPALEARLSNALFTNDLSTSGDALQVTTNAHFDTLSSTLGKAKQTVGSYLQSVWNSGQSIGNGFLSLSALKGGTASFSSSLDSLSGQTLGAIAATRYRAGQTFVNNMLGGCPDGEENGRCVWGHFADSTTDRDTTTDVLGYHLSEQTYQFGTQAPVGRDFYLGGSFAYQHATLNDNGGFAAIQGDNFMGGATLTWRPGHWRINGGIDVGGGSYGSTRRIVVASQTEISTASPSFYDAGAHLRVGYDFALNNVWDLKPYGSLHVRWAHGDAYTETGSGDFNLSVQSENHTEVSGDVGAKLRGSFGLRHDLVLHPYVSAALEGLANSDWAARARFVGDTLTDGFKVSTPLPNALGEFAVGVDLTRGERWSLRAQYGRDEGRDFTDQTWSVRFGVAF